MKNFFLTSIICVFFLAISNPILAQVWPGDANNNGEVNNFDLLYLGYAFGQQGAVRSGASTNWLAQTAAPGWGVVFPPNQLDISYADCDGNGIVDLQDILVLNQNYHFTNTVTPDPLLQGTAGLDPTVQIKRTTTDTLTPGNLEFFEIHLGPNHINNFYGISFTISYDTAYVDSVVNVFPAIGWITSAQGAVVQMSQDYLKSNAANGKHGRLDISYSRTNGVPVFGSGIIGLFSIIMEENVSGKMGGLPVNFEFEVLDIRMVGPTLDLQPTVSSISEFTIMTNNVAPIIEESNLLIYPNPAHEYCTVYSEHKAINRLEVIDLNGRLVQTLLPSDKHQFKIQLYDLPKGIYVLKFSTPTGIIIKKLMVSD